MRLIDADELWMEVIHTMDYCDDILEIIEHQKIIEPTRSNTLKWIPCSERLPEERDVYMVTGKNGNVNLFLYTNTEESDEYWKLHILAWMPLPEPYKGEQA